MVLNWEKDKGYTLPARLPGTLIPESINEKLLGYHPGAVMCTFPKAFRRQ